MSSYPPRSARPSRPQRRDGALRSGADAFEAKPLRVSSLLEMSTRVAAEAAEAPPAGLGRQRAMGTTIDRGFHQASIEHNHRGPVKNTKKTKAAPICQGSSNARKGSLSKGSLSKLGFRGSKYICTCLSRFV